MIGDHHGRTAGRATLLVRAADEIFGMHTHYAAFKEILNIFAGDFARQIDHQAASARLHDRSL